MNLQELERDYRDIHRPAFESLAAKVAELLKVLMEEAKISNAQVEYRAKTVSSFIAKVRRKSYEDPFSDIKDFAGIRVVTYYNDDVSRVADLIHQEFSVDPKHSTDKLKELEVDEFGYRSFHLVCSLGASRKSLIEWKRYSDLSFEIQIRSVLQHAWAAISHKLDYKSASQAPAELRRQLFRLSALLELADDEFASIRDRSQQIVERYREEVDSGELDISLNIDSLGEFIREKVDLKEWYELGLQAGMSEPDEEQTPLQSLHELFNTLQSIGVKTLAELDLLIRKHKPRAKDTLSLVARAVKNKGEEFQSIPTDNISVLLALSEQSRIVKNYRFGNSWKRKIRQALNELIKKEFG